MSGGRAPDAAQSEWSGGPLRRSEVLLLAWMVVVVLLLAWIARFRLQQREDRRWAQRVEQVSGQFLRRVRECEQMLLTERSLFLARPIQFRAFAGMPVPRFPGVTVAGFVAHPSSGRASDNAAGYGWSDRPATAATGGVNLALDPGARAGATYAADSGGPGWAPRAGEPWLLFLPVYQPGMATGTVAERRAALRGWFCAWVNPRELLPAVIGQAEPDVAAAWSEAGMAGAAAASGARRARASNLPFEHGGRRFVLRLEPLPEFDRVTDRTAPGWILLTGLVVAAWVLTHRRLRLARVRAVGEIGRWREEAMQWRALTETAGNVIIRVETDGTIQDWNPEANRVFGYMPEEAVGRDLVSFLFPPESHEAMRRALASAVAGEIVRDHEVPGIECNQLRSMLIWNLGPVHDARGAVAGVVLIGQDITARQELELEREAGRTAALESARRKAQFVANMSHEIRTPLNGVLGMTDLALATPLSPPQRGYLEIIRRSGEHLRRVLNDALDFSRLEAGRLELLEEPFRLRAFLDAAVEPLLLLARQKGLEAALTVDPALGDRWVGDVGRIEQVLANLIGNAAKFTERGSLRVDVGPGDSAAGVAPDGREWVAFRVTDTGMGISAAEQARVFEAFTQADSSVARRHGGAGLGLAICRELARLLSGTIRLESVEGRGSTFFFTVPLRTVAEILEPAPLSPSPTEESSPGSGPVRAGGRPLRVLVAEDHPVNREVVGALLVQMGHEVTFAGDGRAVLELIRDQEFDLILMDVEMPGLDGRQATQEIRRREAGTGRRVPIVAVTAHALPGHREECLAAGMDDHVGKPIRREELAGAIERVCGDRSVSATWTGAVESAVSVEPGSGVIDADRLWRDVDGNVELLRRLVSAHFEHSPGLIESMRVALTSGDFVQMAKLAHTLRGSLGQLMAVGASQAAEGLERAAGLADRGQLAVLLPRLEMELEGFNEALRELVRGRLGGAS